MLNKKLIIILLGLTFLISSVTVFAEEEVVLWWEDIETGEREYVMGDFAFTLREPFDSYNEAPELTAKVEDGELPPLEERLPKNPAVLPVFDEIGEYGGRLVTPSNRHSLISTSWFRIAYVGETLVNINNNYEIVPNLARSYKWNEDKTILTMNLREGVKWSDGTPFTAEDILFWWEDYMKYHPDPEEEINLSTQYKDSETGEPMKVEMVDEYTVNFVFETPNPSILESLCTGVVPHLPKHYYEDMHPKYTGTEGEEALEQYNEMVDDVEAEAVIGEPTLAPWVFERRIDGERNIYQRNPYYWKVDPKGNQLPYLDEWSFELVLDDEIMLARALKGDFHYDWWSSDPTDLPVMHQQSENGDYRVEVWNSPSEGSIFWLNWDMDDEQLRDLWHKHKFRVALSHAIDRELWNELAWEGLRNPGRTFLSPYHPLVDALDIPEDWLQKYADHDPEKSNQLLDELGLERGEDGIRYYPDSKDKIRITLAYNATLPEVHAELMEEFMEDIGIEINVRSMDSMSWIQQLNDGNEMQIVNAISISGFLPYQYYMMFAREPRYAEGMRDYGTDEYDPHPDIKKLHDLYLKGVNNPDEEERLQYMREAFKLYSDNLYVIGIASGRPNPVIVSNDLRNSKLFSEMMIAAENGHIGLMVPDQLFLKQ